MMCPRPGNVVTRTNTPIARNATAAGCAISLPLVEHTTLG
jgi:hypothetical protein